ncbi:hypothetical protein [Oscillatoria sp. FACHB-1406]|uniref:hypothetical protein n=1 Tax=Oscillatoria sp. FACHB-1406 TaxID=2692846 RepID=UPI001685C0AA|nr:hypothetical protein [Oscillatoria sp. FACHB-1406]MBD2580458.1 hypothetical protein [Oscillatoria sp. FACHB-1406]
MCLRSRAGCREDALDDRFFNGDSDRVVWVIRFEFVESDFKVSTAGQQLEIEDPTWGTVILTHWSQLHFYQYWHSSYSTQTQGKVARLEKRYSPHPKKAISDGQKGSRTVPIE